MTRVVRLVERLRSLGPTLGRWTAPVRSRPTAAPRAYWRYLSSWRAYSRLPSAEPLGIADSYPCLFDRTPTTPYDPHYFHQAVWAAERIVAGRPAEHVDVGSDVTFVGMLSVSVPVVFVDIRLFPVELPRLRSITGDLAGGLPFRDRSVSSLSCLHVAEHVGLGRYGDDLNPGGTRDACKELQRILTPGGRLYFSLPVGRPRVCFNAHRVHAPRQIVDYFGELELEEFSVVGDDYRLALDADVDASASLDYGCGLFVFRRA